MRRQQALETLPSRGFDLLVIGAGVIGARVALEASLAGMSVALVDARDFGAATSSASSKLIHGGLRYLQMGDVGLVREAHSERRALVRRVAPHLVRPIDFLVPVYRGGPHGAFVIGAGMMAYAALSGFQESRSRMLSPEAAARIVPDLRLDGLRGAGLYRDAQAHDARLVLATVTAASRAGACVLNHAPVTGLEFGAAGGAATLDPAEGRLAVHFAAAVNAAGPWVDAVRALEDPGAAPIARLSKGAHVTVPLPEGWRAGLTVPMDRGRVAFAVPWEGTLLLGTTDTEFADDPARAEATEADIDTVLGEAGTALGPGIATRERVLSAFAGLRVLPRVAGDSAAAPREHLVAAGVHGMVSVAGGKLTTHRRIAVDVLRRLRPGHRLHPDPLPGAGSLPPPDPRLPAATWDHLAHLYGSEVSALLAGADGDPWLLEPVAAGAPDIWAQVVYGARSEWALEVDDVLRRRTTLWHRGAAVDRQRVAAAMAAATGNRGDGL